MAYVNFDPEFPGALTMRMDIEERIKLNKELDIRELNEGESRGAFTQILPLIYL
jgi:hypothetical protein